MPRRNRRQISISVQRLKTLQQNTEKMKKNAEDLGKLVENQKKEIEDLLAESQNCKLCNQEGGGRTVVLHHDCIEK